MFHFHQHPIFYYFLPIKSLEYFEKYFSTARLILFQDKNCKSRIRSIQFAILFRCFYYGIFYFIPITELQMVALFDESYSFGAHRSTYQLIAIINCLLSLYFFEKIYVNPNTFLITFLKGILFENTCAFYQNVSLNVYKSLQHFAKIVLTFTQVYILVIGK